MPARLRESLGLIACRYPSLGLPASFPGELLCLPCWVHGRV